jgi:hypothetical protein
LSARLPDGSTGWFNGQRHDGSPARRLDGSTVGGTTARRLDGLTVSDQLLDGLTVWRINGLTDRPLDCSTALWLDGSMADGLVVQLSTA